MGIRCKASESAACLAARGQKAAWQPRGLRSDTLEAHAVCLVANFFERWALGGTRHRFAKVDVVGQRHGLIVRCFGRQNICGGCLQRAHQNLGLFERAPLETLIATSLPQVCSDDAMFLLGVGGLAK